MKEKMVLKEMIYIVAFAALASIIALFEVPIGITGIKLDLSDIIMLLSLFTIGFKNTMYVILSRFILRFLMPSKTSAELDIILKLLGEIIAALASFIILAAYIITKKIYKIKEKPFLISPKYEKMKTSKTIYLIAPLISSFLLVLILSIFHFLFTMPLYLSGSKHFIIFTFLEDPEYKNQNIIGMISFIISSFALVSIIKGFITTFIFLHIRERIDVFEKQDYKKTINR